MNIECRGEVTSTNNILKEYALLGSEETVLIAHSQTAGKGRLGRSFFSPQNTGLYMSLLLKPSSPPEKLTLLTPAAAVAACWAIESVGGEKAQIKWVNDLQLEGKKICGILTETVCSGNGERYVIVGAGINVYAPEGGFPEDISNIAGSVFTKHRENLRNEIAAAFINKFIELYDNIENVEFIDEYRARSCVVGRRINVIKACSVRAAQALDIDNECRLIVRYDDGTTEALYSGEISIRTV